ncbi:YjjG family noncanonical pyrimidine nucleotidase [[Clostridium] dakarense]|uniref:YjjG family noncanonical pyrimidine nucleotidase n=1 Tax=Faecalimicrobium dakarense TaxID=1301100 RepID=UPI0004BB260A|nr:YjjG family noncanonical pyrimidine nucleotidase [[Clostridium] dakarense]
MKYKIILFDADDTLFDFKKSEDFAIRNLVSTLDTNLDEDYIIDTYKDINTKIWVEFEEGKITSDSLKVERFNRLIKKLNINSDANELCNMYVKFLGDGSFLYKETEELLNYLSKNYRIGIITNGLADVQHRRIRNSAVGRYFEDVVISDEIKIAKPSPEIFEHALNNLDHSDKESVLMVGDSLNSDIKGGINAGFDTCWFNQHKKENNLSIKPTYEINSLLELKNIL